MRQDWMRWQGSCEITITFCRKMYIISMPFFKDDYFANFLINYFTYIFCQVCTIDIFLWDASYCIYLLFILFIYLYCKDTFNLEAYINNTLYKSHKYELIFMQTILYSMNYRLIFFLAGHKTNCLFNLCSFAYMQMFYSSKSLFEMYLFNNVI